VDIVGYGAIGRNLSIKLAHLSTKYSVASITDSSAVLYPKDSAQVLEVAKWKAERNENKLSGFPDAKIGAKGDLLQGIQFSHSSIVVDATNSDYTKHFDAKGRAELALNSGKHYVTANKVGLAYHYSEIFDLARRRGLLIGYGATNISARYAIPVAQCMAKDELTQILGLLNSATTMILSTLEENPSLSMDQAIEIAGKEGVLERDSSIDLGGLDAAAKTAILSNAVFPERKITVNDVSITGIKDGKAENLIETVRKDPHKKYKVREVSEITKDKALVEPRLVEANSPLAVGGRAGVVSLFSLVSGEVTIKSTFSSNGPELTSSVLLSDINHIASTMG
jgi:homoserine dehydrogenase